MEMRRIARQHNHRAGRIGFHLVAVEFIAGGGEGSSDCLITDLHMPGMSGLDLIRQLKARNSKLPAIMVTGRSEPGLEAKAAANGAVCVLMKPFEADALIDHLERALRI